MWEFIRFMLIAIPFGILVGEVIYAFYYLFRTWKTTRWSIWRRLTHRKVYVNFIVAAVDVIGSLTIAAVLAMFLPPSLGGPVGMFFGLAVTVAIRVCIMAEPLTAAP